MKSLFDPRGFAYAAPNYLSGLRFTYPAGTQNLKPEERAKRAIPHYGYPELCEYGLAMHGKRVVFAFRRYDEGVLKCDLLGGVCIDAGKGWVLTVRPDEDLDPKRPGAPVSVMYSQVALQGAHE